MSGKGSGGPSHPGGSGAVLGTTVIRYSGLQGVAMVAGNLLQLITLFVITAFLGPSELGRFSLLFFLAALLTLSFSLPCKPGTVRRVFGGGDDDDDDDDEDTVVATSPKRSLGVGVLWSIVLGTVAAGLTIYFAEPLADGLLGDPDQANLIVWAGVMGGAGVLMKVASISLWLERRPGAFMVGEMSRPVIGLVAVVILLATGGGVEAAIAGAAAGAIGGALICFVLLRSSFEPNFQPSEVVQIIKRGAPRVPIVSSMWTLQNADVFLLSQAVDYTDLGIYTLASRLGFVVSFLPQGFRVAMRPMRKSVVFKAVRSQYGRAVTDGQILGYFSLLCITAVLSMVLLGDVLIEAAPPEYADAAPLIPLTALAFVCPSLYRTLNQTTSWEGKGRPIFIAGVVLAAVIFAAFTLLLAPEIGVYAAPVGVLAGFAIPVSFFFLRCQLGDSPIEFPYAAVGKALAAAVVIGGAFKLLPGMNTWLELIVVIAGMGLYAVLLLALRVIPEDHWPALTHIAGSVVSGRADRFNPRRGLRAIEPDERARLRQAVLSHLPPEELAALEAGAEPAPGQDPAAMKRTEGRRLVRLLRQVARSGGTEVKNRTPIDGSIAEFLFADEPTAVRNAAMRKLLSNGADANDLRALEDLVKHLSGVPDDAWEGTPAKESPVARRRRAVGRRGRETVARAARGIGRRI
jgi:O-antigen/teichoic acid export membrane protein